MKSTLMTTLASSMAATPDCDAQMAGMSGGRMESASPGHAERRHHPASPSRCPYCAAAAHAPLTAHAAPLSPTLVVSFATYRMAASLGPRGPPPVLPRARGPPPTA